jgi:hypothetical protein
MQFTESAKSKIIDFSLKSYFLGLSFLILYMHIYLLDDYVSFVDTSWVYALTLQLLDGKLLYKDIVWSVGPIPIIVEYFAQIVKPGFATSVFIGLILKVFFGLLWFDIFRKYVNIYIAFAVFIFLTAQYNIIYFSNWSTTWENFCISLLIWSILRIQSYSVNFYISGSLFLLLFSRQSSFALVFFFVISYLVWNGVFSKSENHKINPNIKIVSILVTFVSLVAVTFLYMMKLDVFDAYIYEVFLSAAEKKGVSLLHGTIDALFGGGAYMTSVDFSFVNLLRVNLAPFAFSIFTILLLTKRVGVIKDYGMIILGILFIILLNVFNFDLASSYLDYSRLFVICSTCYLMFAVKFEDNLSLDKNLLILVNIIALGSVFSYELSHPGRGWGNFANIFPIAILNCALINKNSLATKNYIYLGFVALLSFISLNHLNNSIRKKENPFVENYKTDYRSGVKRVYYEDANLGKVKMPIEKESFLRKVKSLGIEGSSCFIYTVEPILYKLFKCDNPTNVYMVIGDFLSSGSAKIASQTLIANPPCYLVTRKGWLAPIDEFTPDSTYVKYENMGREAQFHMHNAIFSLLPSYNLIFDFKSDIHISENMLGFYGYDWEALSTHKVYLNKNCKK